jgi:hypothetical protein
MMLNLGQFGGDAQPWTNTNALFRQRFCLLEQTNALQADIELVGVHGATVPCSGKGLVQATVPC